MKTLNFNIIKLTLSLVIGIWIAYSFTIPVSYALYAAILLILLSGGFLLFLKKDYVKPVFTCTSLIAMVALGILVTNMNNEKLNKTHYSNFDLPKETITFRIRSVLKPSKYHDKYIIDVLKLESKVVSGKALLNIYKDSIAKPLKVDAIYITSEGFKDINTSANPNQFNYKKYLERKYIYKQIYSNQEWLLRVSTTKHSIYGYAEVLREYINSKLNNYSINPDELSIINALILGQRQTISAPLKSNYINAGAIHILAVSGLHVGILLTILNLILPSFRFFKHGKTIKAISVIILLWLFAIIAGLSPSVTRAVTMFTIVTIAIYIKRPTNVYNTLVTSILILLLIKPLIIFDVGFQLSYLAVFAIVSIYPIFTNLWKPKNKILKLYWDIFSVTLAAQFGVIPISIYYFHQFPSLFFISNLIIIPFLGFILAFGILVIILASFNALPEFILILYTAIIRLMNRMVQWVAEQSYFIIQDIPLSVIQMLFSYLLIIALVRLAIKQNHKRGYSVVLAVVLFLGGLLHTKHKTNTGVFTVFHKNKHTLIGVKTNATLNIYHNLDRLNRNKMLSNYKIANNIETVSTATLQSIYSINNDYIYIIDSLAAYKLKTLKPKYILLRNSPKINLKRVIDSLQPKYIIADGSNYKTYIKRWQRTCKNKKLPFHYTGEKGAFIIPLY